MKPFLLALILGMGVLIGLAMSCVSLSLALAASAKVVSPAKRSMAMGAVAQMTRELSTEWSGQGVRVNAILPAQVVNPGLEARMAADPKLQATYLRGIPAGRLGQYPQQFLKRVRDCLDFLGHIRSRVQQRPFARTA